MDADLEARLAAATARLDAREDPAPAPEPPPAPAATVLADLRLVISAVNGPEGQHVQFATFGPDGPVPIGETLPVLLRDTANAILQIAASGVRWAQPVFAAAKTTANHFAAHEQAMDRVRVAKAAADLKAKGVS